MKIPPITLGFHMKTLHINLCLIDLSKIVDSIPRSVYNVTKC